MLRTVFLLLASSLLVGCSQCGPLACLNPCGVRFNRPHIPARVAARVHHHGQESPPPPRILPPSDTGIFPVPTQPVFGSRLDGRELGRLQASEPVAPPAPMLDGSETLPSPDDIPSPQLSRSPRPQWKAAAKSTSLR